MLILIALNILRLYLSDKFPQYMPDIDDIRTRLPERIVSVLMIVLAACYVVFIVILLPMWYKTLRYTVTDRNVTAVSGLFSRTTRIMKISSIQNVSRVSMPLSKISCFNFITLGALGGRIVIMFLSEKDCAEIMGIFGKTLNRPADNSPKVKYTMTDKSSADYILKDSAGILTSDDLKDIADDYSGYTQLSFTDPQTSQLSFSDMEDRKD